jgi:uroporphyrinogen decarboxylase
MLPPGFISEISAYNREEEGMTQPRKDEMTEKERWDALLERQPIDRVPLFLFSQGFSARNVGYPLSSVYEESEKSFWLQVWTNEMFGASQLIMYIGGAFGAREFGGQVKMPESEYSMSVSLLKQAVETAEEVMNLKLPDVKKAGTIPLFVQFSRLQEKYEWPITTYAGGILTRAGYVCSPEKLAKWMIKRPDLVHHLSRLVADLFIEMHRYWVELFGAERIVCVNGSPVESNQLISPKQFETFALPYQKEVYEKAQALGIKHFWTHICGEQNLNLPHWSQFSHGDPGIISIGHEIDIETASEWFPNDIIMGNVEPSIIQTGTPEEIYERSRICIEKGKKHRSGFILAPGCELPVMAPPYNVWMLRKAVNDFGWYE